MNELIPELVRRAAEIVGGFEKLAAYLNVQEHAVGFWVAGKATAPADVTAKLVDLVLHDDIARAMQDRRKEPRVALNRAA